MKEHQMGELENQLFEAILGKFTSVFFKNSLCGLGWWHVKQNCCCHILSEMLDQHPHTDACVVSRKAQLDKLSNLHFHFFWGWTIIQDYENAGSL